MAAEDAICECNKCRMCREDKYDAVWGRDLENRARNMMVNCHNQFCHSACTKRSTSRTRMTDEKPLDSQAKPHTRSRGSYYNDDVTISGKKSEIATPIEGNSKLVNLPSNIPDSFKSGESSDSTSVKSDSVINDLKLDSGNMRHKAEMTDATCQVSLDRKSPDQKNYQSSVNFRLCKSCLATSSFKPDSYIYNLNEPLFNPDPPEWSRPDRFYRHVPFEVLRDRPHSNFYQHYRSVCHCCPPESSVNHNCCYQPSAQLNAAHYYCKDNLGSEDHNRTFKPSPPTSITRGFHSYTSEPVTIHELSISIDRILDFPMFNQELNEDADCFVDYSFPLNQNDRGKT